MKKAEREALENVTCYRVAKAFGATGDTYEVRKLLMNDNLEREQKGLYYVTLNQKGLVWCDCTGFRIQKFAHRDHKHVKLVAHFQALEQADEALNRGAPAFAQYHIRGTGAHTKIHHDMTQWETEDNE